MAEVVNKSTKKSTKRLPHSKQTYVDWFEMMLRIRRFEEAANRVYLQKKIRGFLHLCIGQEAIAAALMTATRKTDPLITAYRQHGIAIARGVSTNSAMAELYGKYTGNIKGKGGSMHFFSKENSYFGGDGIVGGQIATGAGLALAEKYKGTDNVAICMFGDGAARQGILHETFNMAMHWKLPVIFICENNFYAMGTAVDRVSNVTEMHKLGLSYEMPSYRINGMSVQDTHEGIKKAVDSARKGNGPVLLEILTYRYKGHSMSDPGKYRTKAELNEYKDRDPIKDLEEFILENKVISKNKLEDIKSSIKEEIAACLEFAENSPLPPAEELYTDNYVQKDYPFLK